MNSQKTLESFLESATFAMRDLFNVAFLRVYILDQNQNLLKFYEEKSKKFDVQPVTYGIAGQSIINKETITVPCTENDKSYNRTIQLNQHSWTSTPHCPYTVGPLCI